MVKKEIITSLATAGVSIGSFILGFGLISVILNSNRPVSDVLSVIGLIILGASIYILRKCSK